MLWVSDVCLNGDLICGYPGWARRSNSVLNYREQPLKPTANPGILPIRVPLHRSCPAGKTRRITPERHLGHKYSPEGNFLHFTRETLSFLYTDLKPTFWEKTSKQSKGKQAKYSFPRNDHGWCDCSHKLHECHTMHSGLLEDYLKYAFLTSYGIKKPLESVSDIEYYWGVHKLKRAKFEITLNQKSVCSISCQKFKKQASIKHVFRSDCSSSWPVSQVWPAKYFFLPTGSSDKGVRSSCLDSKCSQRSQGPPAVPACGPAQKSQKSLLPIVKMNEKAEELLLLH